MVTDPYKVLGISQGASKDEIKRAYRQKAKEYHPDLHPNDPLAVEKMNEVNEAYDMLNNPEKYRGRQQSGGYGAGYGGSQGGAYGTGGYSGAYGGQGQNSDYRGQGQNSGWGTEFDPFGFEDFFHFGQRRGGGPDRPVAEPGDSVELRRVIDFIHAGNYRYARNELNVMVSGLRNARWYYLSAITAFGLGDYVQATEHIARAVQAEPDNAVYAKAMQDIRSSETAYNSAGAEYSRYGDGFGRFCRTCCAMQLFCTCCC
ncbi:MAG: DnaJ domain-containing protein [Lachnospiraceae bacterium]|nr:DnaJ domain-containing protein [Lachnospiraceae bacterium]